MLIPPSLDLCNRITLYCRGNTLLRRWVGTVWLCGEQLCKRVNGCAGKAQVLAAVEAEHAERQSVSTKKAA